MTAMTVEQAFRAAVAMEETVREVFLSFGLRFATAPGVAQFFQSLAKDETDHARLWREILKSIPDAKRDEPVSSVLAGSIASAQSLLARNPASGVQTLADACELTRMMENSELLAVFRALSSELVTDAKRREFLDLQIQGHLQRVEQFTSGPGRCGRMDSFPAAPAG